LGEKEKQNPKGTDRETVEKVNFCGSKN